MRRSLSYADAVKMLGGGEIALVKVLDRFSAVGLLVPGIDLIAACKELVRAGDQLLTRFGERLRGIDRLTRTERLRAAHAVIVLTAYFDTLQGVLRTCRQAIRCRWPGPSRFPWPAGRWMPGCGALVTR